MVTIIYFALVWHTAVFFFNSFSHHLVKQQGQLVLNVEFNGAMMHILFYFKSAL